MTNIVNTDLLCPCCQAALPSLALIASLNLLQATIGQPIIVTSGYRCPKHNAQVGGVPLSQHLTGRAADIRAPGVPPLALYLAADQIPMFQTGAIGLYTSDYIHVDVRPQRTRYFRSRGVDYPIVQFLAYARTA